MAVEPLFKDGDESDGDEYIDSVVIKVLDNGFTVTVTDTNEGEETKVFVSGRDNFAMMQYIQDSLGIN